MTPRWYVVDCDGLATLCKDEADAHDMVDVAAAEWPRRGPYTAVLLGDVAAERERCAQIADEHARKRYNWGSENADIYHAQAHWAARIAEAIRKEGNT